jgi:pyruvate formate lyase activating enzyme
MKISGLQKVTLIDYPGRVACTLFLFGCNFRCGFCHNPDLILEKRETPTYSEEEILKFLESRKNYLDGVCITGGEPLLTLEKTFLKKVKEMGFLIKLDTNGSFPKKLKELIEEKLVDFVAMDIKNSPEKYSRTIEIPLDLKKIEESIKIISEMDNYEFRTTIVETLHDLEDISKIGKWLEKIVGEKSKRFVLQGFKGEEKLLNENFRKIPNTQESELKEMKKIAENYFEEVEIRV